MADSPMVGLWLGAINLSAAHWALRMELRCASSGPYACWRKQFKEDCSPTGLHGTVQPALCWSAGNVLQSERILLQAFNPRTCAARIVSTTPKTCLLRIVSTTPKTCLLHIRILQSLFKRKQDLLA